jgi:hypothetical protein
MTIQRRYAPISGRFETESLAGLTGISKVAVPREKHILIDHL